MLLLQCDLSFVIKIKFGTLTALSGIALVSQVSVIDMTWALFSWAIVSSSSTFGNKDNKCESSFLCGDLSKHSDEKLAIQVKKRDISTMEAAAKKISQELTARKTALLGVNNSIATSIEEKLLDEFPNEYSDNGVKDWLKIQQDVALTKKSFKGNAVPSHAAVKRIIEEKYEDKILNLKSS